MSLVDDIAAVLASPEAQIIQSVEATGVTVPERLRVNLVWPAAVALTPLIEAHVASASCRSALTCEQNRRYR